MADDVLSGSLIIRELKRSGIDHILALPDITTSEGLLFPIASDKDFKLVRVCKEDEAIGISAGLSYGGKRSLVLFQNTGFFDSINAIRGVAAEFNLPILMMAGLLNRDTEVPLAQSKRYAIRIMEPIMDAMGIHHELIDTDADIERIGPTVERCFGNSEPVLMMIGRRPQK
jgi:sulfopyruvate decarboxylase subunit alpha